MTSTGRERLGELEPMTDAPAVSRAQRATTEGTAFLAGHPGFPLRAPSDLDAIISALAVEGRALEPLRLFGVANYLESIEQTRGAVRKVGDSFPLLSALVETVASPGSACAPVSKPLT